MAFGGRLGVRGLAGDHDPDVPAVEPDFHDLPWQLRGDLGGHVGQGRHEREPHRRLQRAALLRQAVLDPDR